MDIMLGTASSQIVLFSLLLTLVRQFRSGGTVKCLTTAKVTQNKGERHDDDAGPSSRFDWTGVECEYMRV